MQVPFEAKRGHHIPGVTGGSEPPAWVLGDKLQSSAEVVYAPKY